MASSGKKKTTMAKLMREARLREKRLDKQARKDARKRDAGRLDLEPTDGVTDGDELVEAIEPGQVDGTAGTPGD
ncbi:MAG TPA: hypothetical protein VG405_13715 [Solirubrobacteraceae bacterium]|jgi:hypothetical protein|nr:hypothetical protein [Solirubrobacteraceae bacterium]